MNILELGVRLKLGTFLPLDHLFCYRAYVKIFFFSSLGIILLSPDFSGEFGRMSSGD